MIRPVRRRTAGALATIGALISLFAGCAKYGEMSQAEIGHDVYLRQCAICHQADGGGVPDLQPALRGSEIVLGDLETLIEAITLGSSARVFDDREGYGNAMAAFDHLSDRELAAVISHLRGQFGHDLEPVDEDEIARLRR